MSSRTLVFNLYPAPTAVDPDAVHIYANDPVVQLVERRTFERNDVQRNALVEHEPVSLESSLFGPSLDWAYREYIVHRLVPSETAAEPLGNAVVAAVDAKTRSNDLTNVRLVKRRARADDQRLYLFNIIVALEWLPNANYMRQLEWGFRRASDLLYDVSNGTMAFGQIIFADNRWMDCADIQITASNRTLPRSWVSGLHEARKYMPIRVGRGVWSRRSRRALLWDEPEAYRALVHEWGHYALELRDEYLTKVAAIDCGGNKLEQMIVVPVQRGASESIMATPDGNSELANPLPITDKRFPKLNVPQGYYPGPGRLPLPLPHCVWIGRLQLPEPEEFVLRLPPSIPVDDGGSPLDEWSVYVLRRDAANAVERIVAQGVLDSASGTQGFRLLGARPNDRVVISGNSLVLGQTVFDGLVNAPDDSISWKMHQAQAVQAAVRPLAYPNYREHRYVNVTLEGPLQSMNAAIYPVGQRATKPTKRGVLSLQTLDGHVLLDADGVPVILAYSQGGSPWSTVAVSTNPIPAGSNDGDLLLFFSTNADTSNERRRQYGDVRVVTTTLPGLLAGVPKGALPCSKAFGVASNAQLDPELSPTAVLFFDPAIVPANHELRVYRLHPVGGRPEELATCVPQSAGFAAVPLAAPLRGTAGYAGGTLVQEGERDDRIEYFQLFAVPVV